MAAAGTPYNLWRKSVLDGSAHNVSDTFKMLLLSSAYSPNYDTHQYLSDVVANELATANGYTAGGVTLASPTWTLVGSGSSGKYVFKTASAAWTASGGSITARWAVIAKWTGANNTSPLVCLVLLDTTPADVTQTAPGTMTIACDATNGWFYD